VSDSAFARVLALHLPTSTYAWRYCGRSKLVKAWSAHTLSRMIVSLGPEISLRRIAENERSRQNGVVQPKGRNLLCVGGCRVKEAPYLGRSSVAVSRRLRRRSRNFISQKFKTVTCVLALVAHFQGPSFEAASNNLGNTELSERQTLQSSTKRFFAAIHFLLRTAGGPALLAVFSSFSCSERREAVTTG
jgi:hypothetical protein